MSNRKDVTFFVPIPFNDGDRAAIRALTRSDLPQAERSVKNGQYAR
jgi:hypothetical protein